MFSHGTCHEGPEPISSPCACDPAQGIHAFDRELFVMKDGVVCKRP